MSTSRAPRQGDTRISAWAAAPWSLRTSNDVASASPHRSMDDERVSSLLHGSASAVYGNTASSSPFAVPMSMCNADSPPTTPPDASNLRMLPSVHAIEGKTDSPSRNDIFSVAKPQPMPAPRLAVAINSTPIASSPSSSSSNSKNSLFFGPSSSPMTSGSFQQQMSSPIVVASPAPKPAAPPTLDKLSIPATSLDRPSYGRSSTEERERERARIRQSRDQVDFRLCPTRDYLLGEGRHCNVYLGSYRLKPRQRKQHQQRQTQSSSSSISSGEAGTVLEHVYEQHEQEAQAARAAWQLCAIKRLHADRQSQLLGLDEAFALRRLGPHPHVVSLIDIRDEVQLSTTAANATATADMAAEQASLGRGAAPIASLAPPTTQHTGTSHHGRSTSETHSCAQLGLRSKQEPSQRRIDEAVHRRLTSQPLGSTRSYDKMPLVRIAAPDEEGEGMPLARSRSPSPAASTADVTPIASRVPSPAVSPAPSGSSTSSSTSSSSNDPPRLLILLELLPHSLSTFAKRNPERVDWPTWRTWALQMAETVEWLHAKGCVHADIKKENILLTDSLDVKLCDFNSAVFPSANAPLLDGAGLGTPAYGAPELTRTAGASPGFSFPCDVWSCGAVLYSLATGVEPFERARSMIDMLYRKRIFFESEENDRIARLSVAEGYAGGSNAGSACASRNGSLRGRNARAARPSVRREGSADSIESVASSIRVAGGNASLRDIAMLLDAAPPTGVLAASGQQREGDALNASQPSLLLNGHQRAASLGKSSQLNPSRSAQPAAAASSAIPIANPAGSSTPAGTSRLHARPPVLRRTTSYGGDLNGEDSSATHAAAPTPASPPAGHSLNASSSPRSPRASNAGLRLAVTAALAQASRRAAQTQTHESSPFDSPRSAHARELRHASDSADYGHSMGFADALEDDEEEELDLRPYRDGSPALILPGGGRLPDTARALLERMLSTDPSLRPTAGQVVAALRNL